MKSKASQIGYACAYITLMAILLATVIVSILVFLGLVILPIERMLIIVAMMLYCGKRLRG